MVINRPNNVKMNIRGPKLNNGVNLQGVQKQKDVKQKLYSYHKLTVGVIARGRVKPKYERAESKKRCRLARGVKAKKINTLGRKTGPWSSFQFVLIT
jgi:hypothetical protein